MCTGNHVHTSNARTHAHTHTHTLTHKCMGPLVEVVVVTCGGDTECVRCKATGGTTFYATIVCGAAALVILTGWNK